MQGFEEYGAQRPDHCWRLGLADACRLQCPEARPRLEAGTCRGLNTVPRSQTRDLHRPAQTNPGPPRPTQARPEPPKPAQTSPDPPRPAPTRPAKTCPDPPKPEPRKTSSIILIFTPPNPSLLRRAPIRMCVACASTTVVLAVAAGPYRRHNSSVNCMSKKKDLKAFKRTPGSFADVHAVRSRPGPG